MAEGLAGLIGAYGSDEEDVEEMEEEEAGGQVTILGRNRSEDEEMQGADLSHLTSAAAARPEADTAATQQQQQQAGVGQEPAQQREPGGEEPAPAGGAAAPPEGGEAQPAGDPEAGAAAATAGMLPPEFLEPPPGECDAALQAKVSMWLNVQRTRGRFINQELRGSRAYRNPEFFRKMVEHLEIDEYGSCFAPQVFDPHNLPKEDFIDALQKEWSAEEERRKAHRAATGRIEFHKSSSQPQLAANPLMPGLNPGVGAGGVAASAAAINPAAALAAAQLKAAQLAAAGIGMPAAQPGGGKGSKWDAGRR